MAREPLTFYRVWCLRKRYSGWLVSREKAFQVALRHGLAFEFVDGTVSMGPLTWFEVGHRTYTRSRTVPAPPVRNPPWS